MLARVLPHPDLLAEACRKHHVNKLALKCRARIVPT